MKLEKREASASPPVPDACCGNCRQIDGALHTSGGSLFSPVHHHVPDDAVLFQHHEAGTHAKTR